MPKCDHCIRHSHPEDRCKVLHHLELDHTYMPVFQCVLGKGALVCLALPRKQSHCLELEVSGS